jgi:hypothetical protein
LEALSMQEKTFEVDGVVFRFVNHPGGAEEMFHGDELLSSVRSMRGGKHTFDLGGDHYEVKVKSRLWDIAFSVKKNGEERDVVTEKTPSYVYLVCAWPFALAIIGGAIGGALGGAAAAVNFTVYKSRLSTPAKVILNLVCGAAAFGIWFVTAAAIRDRWTQ